MARVLARLGDHLGEPVDAADLTAVTTLSANRFYEVFRSVTVTRPKDYLLRHRTGHARDRRTAELDLTVAEVADGLGFLSSRYFATVYRRRQGHRRPGGSPAGVPGHPVHLGGSQLVIRPAERPFCFIPCKASGETSQSPKVESCNT